MDGFDMLRLGLFVLAEADGDPEPFRLRLEKLWRKWATLQVEIGCLQQEIYEAVQGAWRERQEAKA